MSLFEPGTLGLLALAALIGALALRGVGRVARAGKLWLTTWIGAYFLLSLPVVAGALHDGLASFPAFRGPRPETAVVVLGGGAGRYRLGDSVAEVSSVSTKLRALEAARVYRLLDAPVVIVSGSRAAGSPETNSIRSDLLAAGVPAERILLETGSRDTRESALAVEVLLRARAAPSAVLVTSATHMRRASRAFHAAGVRVVEAPSPVPARSGRGWRALVPDADALLLSETCLHEYAGLLYYRLRGWV